MLTFLRKYQRGFFFFVTFLLIASFSVFGAISTFFEDRVSEEQPIGLTVEGTAIFPSTLYSLCRFLATDATSALPGEVPNLCNDGVLRRDFLESGLSQLFVESYFPLFAEGLKGRVLRAQKFEPYAHPEIPSFSAETVWARFVPEMGETLTDLKKQEEVSQKTFAHLTKLYLLQSSFPPELLRRILINQAQQMGWTRPDPFLERGDFSLFGFHSLVDWFGPRFLELHAQWILNGAAAAEEEGYAVSLEEAKGDLLRNFTMNLKRIGKEGLSLKEHLQALGLTEKEAIQAWRSILLFRKQGKNLGDSILLDRLPYQEFASYAYEELQVDHYAWDPALTMKDQESWASFETYLAAVSPDPSLQGPPQIFYSLDEIEKRLPDLVQSRFRAKVTKASREQIALRASLQEIVEWQKDPKNWDLLREKFPQLPILFSLGGIDASLKAEMDGWTRLRLLELHPEWIEEELLYFPPKHQEVFFSSASCSLAEIHESTSLAVRFEYASLGDEEAKEALLCYSEDGETFFRFEEIALERKRELLSFAEAKELGVLRKEVERRLGSFYANLKKDLSAAKAPFFVEGKWKPLREVRGELIDRVWSSERKELAGIQADVPLQARRLWRWTSRLREKLAQGQNIEMPQEDPTKGSFGLQKKEKTILRKGKEKWMIEQGFASLPETWSLPHCSSEGEVSFFFLKEKRMPAEPVLIPLRIAKERLSADLQRSLGKNLIKRMQEKGSIVIPEESKP